MMLGTAPSKAMGGPMIRIWCRTFHDCQQAPSWSIALPKTRHASPVHDKTAVRHSRQTDSGRTHAATSGTSAPYVEPPPPLQVPQSRPSLIAELQQAAVAGDADALPSALFPPGAWLPSRLFHRLDRLEDDEVRPSGYRIKAL